VVVHVELKVQAPGVAVPPVAQGQEHRFGHGTQRLNDCGIDQRQLAGQLLEQRAALDRQQPAGQLIHHLLQHRRLEDAAAFAEAAQPEPLDPQPLLHLRQVRNLLQRAHGADQGVEQIEQDQQDVVVEVKLAVVGLVTVAADLVQRGEQLRHAA